MAILSLAVGTRKIPQRLVWVVESLAVDPADRLLEIGCGSGIAVSLICDRLVDGTITAVDRSAVAIEAAERHNAEHVRSGKATLQRVELAAAELDGETFDTIFAVNVNLFWVRRATREVRLIERILRPTGALHLFYGYGKPETTRTRGVVDRLAASLSEGGLAIDDVVPPSPDSAHMLRVTARPGSGGNRDGTRS